MDYSGTLRRGWEIAWQNKWLWLLALLPTLLGVINLFLAPLNEGLVVDPTVMTPEQASSFAGRAVLFSCLSLLVTLLVTFLGLITRGGMITGVARLARGEATGFGRSFNEGWRKVLPLLGMTILLYALPVILFVAGTIAVWIPVAIGAMTSSLGQDGPLAGLEIVLICCLVVGFLVAMLFLGFIHPFAFRGIMLRRMGVVESIRHGWRVLRENVGQIILLALPFVLAYVLFFAVFAAIYVLLLGLLWRGGIENALLSGAIGASDWRFLLVFLFYGLLGAVLSTWQSATFTLGYLQWTGKDVLDVS